MSCIRLNGGGETPLSCENHFQMLGCVSIEKERPYDDTGGVGRTTQVNESRRCAEYPCRLVSYGFSDKRDARNDEKEDDL